MNRLDKTRLDLLDSLPKELVIAELGVLTGEFSEQIIKRCEPRMLYLVDTFYGIISSGDHNGENVRQVDMSQMHWQIERNFTRLPVSVVKSDSILWLEDQDTESLDVVYLDTTHTENRTRKELRESLRVVKTGGYICGHDYADDFPGVIRAVDDFFRQHSLPITIYGGDKLASFQIKKILKTTQLRLSDL